MVACAIVAQGEHIAAASDWPWVGNPNLTFTVQVTSWGKVLKFTHMSNGAADAFAQLLWGLNRTAYCKAPSLQGLPEGFSLAPFSPENDQIISRMTHLKFFCCANHVIPLIISDWPFPASGIKVSKVNGFVCSVDLPQSEGQFASGLAEDTFLPSYPSPPYQPNPSPKVEGKGPLSLSENFVTLNN